MNLEDYPVFAVSDWRRNEIQTRYHVSAYPTLKWFSKDGEKRLPIDVDVERTKEALVQYCEDMTKEHEESELSLVSFKHMILSYQIQLNEEFPQLTMVPTNPYHPRLLLPPEPLHEQCQRLDYSLPKVD